MIDRAVVSLRLIFWGGMLCVVDVTFSSVTTVNGVSSGFVFDFLNDAVGAALITVGAARLSTMEISRRFVSVMHFVVFVAFVVTLDSIRLHFVTDWPTVVQLGANLIGIVSIVAIPAFCVAMRWLCDDAFLERASRSWSLTLVLFVCIYVLPLGLLRIAILFASLTGSPFLIDLGPAGLLLLPVFAAPLIHLFMSTSRMKTDLVNRGV
ncbi:MAG TPA: hypothetical protein P5081_06685 [Phycisphaerae bacterium]|nr:hypothetical protein [Phycisphaerae bacterium]HRW52557.1 hypothetical protein [Phycisphaerae bacterium]